MPSNKEIHQVKNREKLLKTVLDALLSSQNAREVQARVVSAVGKAFNCDRCYFRIYDKNKNENLNTDVEYRASPEIESITQVKTESEVHKYFIKKVESSKKPIHIYDVDEYIQKNKLAGSSIEKFLQNLGVKSDYLFPVRDREDNLIYLVLHYTKKPVILSKENIDFLKLMAEQAANAISHIELYEEAKKRADKEKTLREITAAITSTLDITEIEHYIVNNIGKLLDADRVFISKYDPVSGRLMPISSEYRSSEEFKSLMGSSAEVNNEDLRKILNKNGEIHISSAKKFLKEKNLQKSLLSEYAKVLRIKSGFRLPIVYGENFLGVIGIHSAREENYFTREDMDFVKIVANHAGIAVHKAILYEKLKKTNQREKFLSEIISTVKGTLDLQEITTLIFKKIREFYKIKKVMACKHLIDKCKTIYGIELVQVPEDEDNNFISELFCKDGLHNVKIEIKEIPEKFQIPLSAKQLVMVPVKLENEKLGNIHLVSEEKVIWEKEDLNLFERIADNVAIAIRDSGLYTKSKFMADVSHELKTPVAIIDAYVNNLLNTQDFKPEILEKYLCTVKNNTIRINNIIENFMSISKLEKENRENIIKFQKINIKHLINNVLESQKPFAMGKNIDFEVKCNNSFGLTGNEVLIEQALLNLIKNAVQYSYSNSKIMIYVDKTDNEIKITVQDFGCGIAEKDLNNIFGRFYRVDKSRSRQTGGTGLGLSIAEKIAEVHGGRIEVKSKPGKGSEFTLIIPAED